MATIEDNASRLLKAGRVDSFILSAGADGTKHVDIRVFPPEGNVSDFNEILTEVVQIDGSK